MMSNDQENTPPATQEVISVSSPSPAPDPKVPKKKGPLPIWLTAAAIGISVGIFTSIFPSQGAAKPTYVVINSTALAEAKAAMSVTKSLSDPEYTAREAVAFGNAMRQVLKRYTDQGTLVLNSNQLAAWPNTADITASVATELGVDLNAKRPPSALELQLKELSETAGNRSPVASAGEPGLNAPAPASPELQANSHAAPAADPLKSIPPAERP